MPVRLTPDLDPLAPVRTEAGAQELRARALGLPQKVRTVLLLVDGKRSVADVRKLMQGAGVAPESLQQLIDLNLIDLPGAPGAGAPASAAAAAVSAPVAAAPASLPVAPAAGNRPKEAEAAKPGKPTLAEILGGVPIDPPSTMTAINRAYAPYLDGSARENMNNFSQNTISAVFGQIGAHNAEPLGVPSDSVKDNDPALSAARSHLTQALNAMAPTDSASLMFRIGRCTTRAEMTDLLREVEVKLARRGRVNEAAEVVRHARALLMA
jgi:hypothetical protein